MFYTIQIRHENLNQSFSFFLLDKTACDDTERSLGALKKLASNPECLSALLDGLGSYMRTVMGITDQSECPGVEKAINELFNQIIRVSKGFSSIHISIHTG